MKRKIIVLLSIIIICIKVVLVNAQKPMRMCAEWEPAFGTLIRWPLGIPSSLVVELAKDDSLYVVVETESQEDQAISSFSSSGVNLDHCVFIRANTYTHWTRDWGPHFTFDENGIAGITDPIFRGYPQVSGCELAANTSEENAVNRIPENPRFGLRGWEEDDAVNSFVAQDIGCPLRSLPIYLTGGNIMTDGHYIAISTEQMLNENSSICNEQEFRKYAKDYLGITDYYIVSDPEIYGIQHIDCYAKLLNEETIVVRQVPAGNEEFECVERLVEELEDLKSCYGRPYKIKRIYCGEYSGENVAAYTNSLIVNKKVLVPLFNISSDQGALNTFREAMPGYEVIGFEYEDNWYTYDALHCRTKAIFDCFMLLIWHKPLDEEIIELPEYRIAAVIDDRSEAGLIEDELLVYWRKKGAPSWNSVTLSPISGVDSFATAIPGQPPQTTVEYYLSAADSSGRKETLPRTAPEGFYSFTVLEDTTGIETYSGSNEPGDFIITNNLLTNNITIELALSYKLPVKLYVCNIFGKRIRTLLDGEMIDNKKIIQWDGNNNSGLHCAPGIYMILLQVDNKTLVKRSILLR